jgi:hypothetical protein
MELAFFCSQACPGDLILKAQDWANARHAEPLVTISGFHTPVERDVLRILLRQHASVVYCLARGIGGFRRSRAVREAETAGRLRIVSPFAEDQRYTTAASADVRNRYIVDRCERVLIAHASPSGKTENLAKAVIASGKQLLTLRSPHNANLRALGAVELDP